MGSPSVTDQIISEFGISRPAFEEIQTLLGHMPSIDELSTLLAMWESNGRQQSLLSWLKCQPHAMERTDYLYSGTSSIHKNIHEPKVKECLNIAESFIPSLVESDLSPNSSFSHWGDEIYMIGKLSDEFLSSEYSSRCLFLTEKPVCYGSLEEEISYIKMILDALLEHSLITAINFVGKGGLFASLVNMSGSERFGFNIICPREVRLDAFLFGEEPGRFIVTVEEDKNDSFLVKLDEARLNCCLLGKVTKGRVIVDDMDFGPISKYLSR